MNSNFEFLDYLIFGIYAFVILGVGLWVSRNKDGKKKVQRTISWQVNLFLGGQLVPSIAANISAEQFIGMSGSGFALDSIASYEWMAAITLIIVGKNFSPIFCRYGPFIPEFVEKRFSSNLKTILAIFD